jgi:tetratricopeptide (TPR) repeat protein
MRLPAVLLFLAAALPASADPAFWERATALLGEGKVAEAETLAQGVLAATPDDADALVIAGTAVLYGKMAPRRDDSIFRPVVDPLADPDYRLSPGGADAVAAYWKRVPALDPARSYLWGDLAQLTFRSGDTLRALDWAKQALAGPADPEGLAAAASVFALNLDWARAAQALALVPGNRTTLLYQGLEAWRTGKDGWRVPLKAFVDNPGPDPAGTKLAAFLLGPDMRDSEAGLQNAAQAETGIAALAVRQKYVERYPDKFQPRLDLARNLAQYGSFAKALDHYGEIDRRGLATTPEQKVTVLFQEAWALQAMGRHPEADKVWEMLVDASDFYVRSAAAWFLGEDALANGKPDQAKLWWTRQPVSKVPMPAVADEPARSKYAAWCAAELKKLN